MAERRTRRVVGPPAGIEHAYDLIAAQVSRQLTDAESLDRKHGVATAALIAVAGAVYAARPAPVVAGVISGWLLVALIQDVRGFLYDDRFGEGVKQRFLDKRLELDPKVIKWHEYAVLKAVQTELQQNLTCYRQNSLDARLQMSNILLGRTGDGSRNLWRLFGPIRSAKRRNGYWEESLPSWSDVPHLAPGSNSSGGMLG